MTYILLYKYNIIKIHISYMFIKQISTVRANISNKQEEIEY